jgi:hypothetical protein
MANKAPKNEPQKPGRSKKKVEFNKVDVYLFEFKEGLDAVPTTGGIPLGKYLTFNLNTHFPGMEDKHHEKKEYSCTQFEKMHSAKVFVSFYF